SRRSAVLRPGPTPSALPRPSVVALYRRVLPWLSTYPRAQEGLPSRLDDLRCMPTPLRRSGSGLLQDPRPGLLPSPYVARFGPLGPLRVGVSTRKRSPSLRPAAFLHPPPA